MASNSDRVKRHQDFGFGAFFFVLRIGALRAVIVRVLSGDGPDDIFLRSYWMVRRPMGPVG